jgi:hypothetical protein
LVETLKAMALYGAMRDMTTTVLLETDPTPLVLAPRAAAWWKGKIEINQRRAKIEKIRTYVM